MTFSKAFLTPSFIKISVQPSDISRVYYLLFNAYPAQTHRKRKPTEIFCVLDACF